MVVLVRCSFLVILVGAFVLGCVCRDMSHKTSHVNRQRKLREDVSDKLYQRNLDAMRVNGLSFDSFFCMRTIGKLGQLTLHQ